MEIKIQGAVAGIELAQVRGIYRDKYKDGYWIELARAGQKPSKEYREGLTPSQRGLLNAASNFNHVVLAYERLNKKELE